jgi:hypothetical protein
MQVVLILKNWDSKWFFFLFHRRQLVDSADQQAEPRYMSYATGTPYQDNRSSTGEDARGQIAQPSRGAVRANSRARMPGTGPLANQADNFAVVDNARNGRPLRSGNTQPPSAPSSSSQQGRNLSSPDQVCRGTLANIHEIMLRRSVTPDE